MENRINCPTCMGEGKILTAVHYLNGDRIYMCDKCKDVWESRNFDTSKAYSYETYMLKTNYKDEDFVSWEYIIK